MQNRETLGMCARSQSIERLRCSWWMPLRASGITGRQDPRLRTGLTWRGSLGNEQKKVGAHVQRPEGPFDLTVQSEQRFA
jgi:hypothetical protein